MDGWMDKSSLERNLSSGAAVRLEEAALMSKDERGRV